MTRPVDLRFGPRFTANPPCADLDDPELFFVAESSKAAATEAREVCSGCPVRAECLMYALDAGEEYGVWGGLTSDERRDLKTPRGAAA